MIDAVIGRSLFKICPAFVLFQNKTFPSSNPGTGIIPGPPGRNLNIGVIKKLIKSNITSITIILLIHMPKFFHNTTSFYLNL